MFAGGDADSFTTAPLARPITVHDLMVHTSGLTYGFQHEHAVDALYRNRGVEFNANLGPLADLTEAAAAQSLVFQPGTRWNYSVSTDVLGCLVEIWSGVPLDAFFNERILGPLGMGDTSFHVREGQAHRLASNYVQAEDGGLRLAESAAGSRFLEPAVTLSGGGGLVSTAADYLRFMRMLRGRGALEGARLLGRKSVELMTMNHLPGDLADMGRPRFAEMPFAGIGFGLGVSVLLDPARAQILGSPGEYAWGGMASTAFWVDPAEDMMVLLLTQLMPSSAWPIRRELRVLTYQALLYNYRPRNRIHVPGMRPAHLRARDTSHRPWPRTQTRYPRTVPALHEHPGRTPCRLLSRYARTHGSCWPRTARPTSAPSGDRRGRDDQYHGRLCLLRASPRLRPSAPRALSAGRSVDSTACAFGIVLRTTAHGSTRTADSSSAATADEVRRRLVTGDRVSKPGAAPPNDRGGPRWPLGVDQS